MGQITSICLHDCLGFIALEEVLLQALPLLGQENQYLVCIWPCAICNRRSYIIWVTHTHTPLTSSRLIIIARWPRSHINYTMIKKHASKWSVALFVTRNMHSYISEALGCRFKLPGYCTVCWCYLSNGHARLSMKVLYLTSLFLETWSVSVSAGSDRYLWPGPLTCLGWCFWSIFY